MLKQKDRESAFELIRVIAQFMIVFYHILYFIIYPATGVSLYKALWFPLHVGVPLFVFISGYFGIRASVKGFVRYFGMVLILSLPYIISRCVSIVSEGGSVFDMVRLPFFLSCTHFWFLRTYLYLYLLSPVINKFLYGISPTQRLYLTCVLLYMSVFVGILGSDNSLKDGKNIISFFLFYTIGDTLRCYKSLWKKIDKRWLIGGFLLFNVIIVLPFSLSGFGRITDAIWSRFFFAYNSPFLLVNAVWVFIIFGRLQFKSRIVNHFGRASLAMYVLHESFIFSLIQPAILYCYRMNSHVLFVLLSVALVTILSLVLSVIVYDILTPVWRLLERIGQYCQVRIESALVGYKEMLRQ